MTTRHPIALPAILLSLAVASPVAAQAPDLSDPQVAHVAVTANSIDIDLAKLAQTKARSPEVQQFAATMITDHSAVNREAAALAGRLHVTPEANAVSQSLESGAAEARRQLEGLTGPAFDRAYIDREVAYHQAVLDALDKVLIPTTSNADLKKLLVDVRPAIATHLSHAKQLQSKLVAGR
jgi:putative membrane protein